MFTNTNKIYMSHLTHIEPDKVIPQTDLINDLTITDEILNRKLTTITTI
jgi:hypothetical protein